jgi:hypothetical protein
MGMEMAMKREMLKGDSGGYALSLAMKLVMSSDTTPPPRLEMFSTEGYT